MTRRAGFTLVEIVVVALITLILMGAAYQVVATNQRTYTVQNVETRTRQILRAGSDALFDELREVSAAGGDILAMDDAAIRMRVMRSFGVVCEVAGAGEAPSAMRVLKRSRTFSSGDAVVVFADNEIERTDDDVWIRATVTDVRHGVVCGSDPDLEAQLLGFAGQDDLFADDAVRAGAPIRSLTQVEYRLVQREGRWFIGRRPAGVADPLPLVGPVNGPDHVRPGLTFRFLDDAGREVSTGAGVRQIEVTLRADGEAVYADGTAVNDSIVTRISLRN